MLIDPLPLDDLRTLDAAIADAEWVLHAASQDLPCLAELGLRPRRLFDTELAARLAGFERVGLAALTEQLLGYTLEKHHSAADWSTRPLPESWLTLRRARRRAARRPARLARRRADRAGQARTGRPRSSPRWSPGARQPPRSRPDPWRRTSGIHRIRGARAQARVRALWYARDDVAARRDSAPGRVLPDSAIVAAAEIDPKDERTLLTLPGFGGRSVRRLARIWLDALDDGPRACPTTPCRPTRRSTARHRRIAGPNATRWRRPAGPLPRGGHDDGRRAHAAAGKPDQPRTRSAGWPGPRRKTSPRRRSAATLRGYGARPWQVGLIATDLATALEDPKV